MMLDVVHSNYLYPPPASRAAIRRAASTAARRSASPAGGRLAGGGGGAAYVGGGGAAYVGGGGAAYVGGGANAVVAGGGANKGFRNGTGAALCGREKAAGAAVLTEPIGFIFANLYRSASGGERAEPRRLLTSCFEKVSSSRDPRHNKV